MAVPAGDERDWKFAKHFNIGIPAIFEGVDTDQEICSNDGALLTGSKDLNGKSKKDAIPAAIELLEAGGHDAKAAKGKLARHLVTECTTASKALQGLKSFRDTRFVVKIEK